jgi:hypothetical protein
MPTKAENRAIAWEKGLEKVVETVGKPHKTNFKIYRK